MSKSFLLRPLAVAALFVASGASQAALTVYTSQAAFLAAVTAAGTDTFAGFSVTGTTLGPLTRTAGSYGYTATTGPASPLFFGSGTTADPGLSNNTAQDTMTFSGFTGGANALSANFFGTNIDGLFATGTLTLTAIDSLGATSTQTVTASSATAGSFLGFVSSGALTSLSVTAVQAAGPALWSTVDNLTLAVAVPEPGTYAMLLAGLGVIGFIARRRRI